jgi:hypothetical protein
LAFLIKQVGNIIARGNLAAEMKWIDTIDPTYDTDPRHARRRRIRRRTLPAILRGRGPAGTTAGQYCRLLLIGYFEGLVAERAGTG